METTPGLSVSSFISKKSPLSPTAKAENVSSPTSEPKNPQGEPVPDWESALQHWGLAWDVHQYGIGIAFGLLACVSAVFLARMCDKNDKSKVRVFLTILILMFLFGSTRCLSLSIDAYQSKAVFPRWISNILWGIGNPCLVSGYALVYIVLRNAFVLRTRFRSWYTSRNIALVTVPYFVFVFIAELTVSYLPSQTFLLVLCQVMYILFALFLVSFYSFVSITLWRAKVQQRKRVQGISQGRQRQAWTGTVANTSRNSVLITCITIIIGGLTLCGLQVYSLVGVYGVSGVSSWPWFGLTTTMRCLELGLSCALLAAWARGAKHSRRISNPKPKAVVALGAKLSCVYRR